MSLVEDLQHRVEDLGVCFLDLVEQDHGIGLAAYRLGELAALAVADITRWRADQPGDVVLLAVFAHVDADQSALFVEEPFRDLLGQQRLAYPRGADEEEYPDRTVLVLEPGPRAADRARDLLDGLLLPYDPLRKVLAEGLQAGHLSARNALGGDARHRGDDLLDMLGRDLHGVGFERPLPFVAAFAQFRTECDFAQACRGGLFVDQFFDRLAAFAPHLVECVFHLAEFGRFARRLQVYARARLVQHIDRLVREEAVGDVAPGEFHAGLQRLFRIAYLVVLLVVGGDVAQDLERLLGRRGLDDDLLEPALERRVAFDVLAVFVERRGADGLQFAPCECRFEDVGRVEAALCRTGTHDGVYLVDEYDRVLGLAQFVEQLLHALLEFAAELRARYERRYVEREERLVGDGVGHLAACNAQSQPFDDGALAHARLADEDRVVLLAAREYLDYALDLLLAPHDGVDFTLSGHLREIYAELVEHVRCVFLFGFVFLAEIEHVYLYLRAEIVAGGEFLDVFGYDFTRDAVHFEYARCRGRAVADDGPQCVGRRDAPHGARYGAQFVGKGAVKLFGARVFAPPCPEYLAFDAQAYLVELPVLQTGG